MSFSPYTLYLRSGTGWAITILSEQNTISCLSLNTIKIELKECEIGQKYTKLIKYDDDEEKKM